MEYFTVFTLITIVIMVSFPVKVIDATVDQPLNSVSDGRVERSKRFTFFPQYTVLQVSVFLIIILVKKCEHLLLFNVENLFYCETPGTCTVI